MASGLRARMVRITWAKCAAPPPSAGWLAVDRGHHHMGKTEPRDGIGNARRLGVIQRARQTRLDDAKGTGARAHIPRDHQGGVARLASIRRCSGSPASTHTVWRSWSRTTRRREPRPALTRIQSGLRSVAVSGRRAFHLTLSC